MKKLMLTLVLSTFLSLLCAINAFAAIYDTDGTGDMEITATVESSYIVTVPASITLEPYDNPYGDEFDYNYSALDKIGCKGNILTSQSIEIDMRGNLKKSDTLEAQKFLVLPEYDEHRFSNNPRESLAHAINKNTFNYIDIGVYAKIVDAGQYEGEITFGFSLR